MVVNGSITISDCLSTVQCRIPGFEYVAAGNSINKKDAQTNAAKDMVQYFVRIGRMSPSEVPEFKPVCTDNICCIYHLFRGDYVMYNWDCWSLLNSL